ncbi:MAG: hypothetical protein OEY88_07830 [Candidatus Bathyarchaeota archaeon]|nr:hypothetical protein [Candidatus Bathyarchaeota archaeon]
MPISIIELDSSTKEENIALILGKNILLKIIEDSEKQTLMKDKVVKKIISIPNLCHDEIRLPIEELIKEETLLIAPSFARAMFSFSESKFFDSCLALNASLSDTFLRSKFYNVLEKEISQTAERSLKKMSKDELEDMRSDFMHRIVGAIDEKLVEKENKKMISIGDRIKDKTGFEILIPSSLLLCPECKVILSTEEFRRSRKCYVCNKKITREHAERIYIHTVHDKVKKMWEKNLWFEAYIARLLRRFNCKTWTSVRVMGASGILHEIDVLAIRNGIVLVCECKTGKVSRNDVFNFCTKVADLKAHISILALIGELPESETREFIKKDPAIIRLENMGKKKEAEILEDLKRKLSIKA